MSDYGGLRQLVVPPALWPVFEVILDRLDLVPVRLPDEEDEIPTYVIHPALPLTHSSSDG